MQEVGRTTRPISKNSAPTTQRAERNPSPRIPTTRFAACGISAADYLDQRLAYTTRPSSRAIRVIAVREVRQLPIERPTIFPRLEKPAPETAHRVITDERLTYRHRRNNPAL